MPIRSSNGERRLKFSVDLGRNLVIIFLVNFCLTILMNLMNQTTNYIEDNYKMALTINITCMMVPCFSLHLGLQQSASNCVYQVHRDMAFLQPNLSTHGHLGQHHVEGKQKISWHLYNNFFRMPFTRWNRNKLVHWSRVKTKWNQFRKTKVHKKRSINNFSRITVAKYSTWYINQSIYVK